MTSRRVVEFYGMARHKARRAEMEVNAATLGELLAQVVEACPALADLCGADGRPGPAYLVSLDGETFVGDPSSPLGCPRVLILSADAGG
jgi:molybdopterin converting factor small subunit